MKVLIIIMYDSCYESSITYLTENGIQDIDVRKEWMNILKNYILHDKVIEDLKNEGLNIDVCLLFNNSELVWSGLKKDIEEVMKVKMKPKECPFCGCDHIDIASLGDCWRALCMRCNASMRKKEKTDLIMAWNMREKDGNS